MWHFNKTKRNDRGCASFISDIRSVHSNASFPQAQNFFQNIPHNSNHFITHEFTGIPDTINTSPTTRRHSHPGHTLVSRHTESPLDKHPQYIHSTAASTSSSSVNKSRTPTTSTHSGLQVMAPFSHTWLFLGPLCRQEDPGAYNATKPTPLSSLTMEREEMSCYVIK